jgi:hypothetical protein
LVLVFLAVFWLFWFLTFASLLIIVRGVFLAADLGKFIRAISAVGVTVAEVAHIDTFTALALELEVLSTVRHNKLLLSEAFVEVVGGESVPFGFSNGELPGSRTVAASLGTVKLQDVVTSVEGDAEIEFLGPSILPDISLSRLDDLAVHHGDSSAAKVNWHSESISRSVIAHWEVDFIVKSNVALNTLAQGLVADSQHVIDLSLTVSLSRFLGHLLLELGDLDNR